MDWFSWLSKSGLEPTAVYSYSVVFSDNELEEDDIAYFNHEFLLSMGISIAKHRLEILKLVSNNNKTTRRSMKTLLFAMKKTKQCLGRYLRAWTGVGSESDPVSKSALVLVHNNHNQMKRNNIYYNYNNNSYSSNNKKKKLEVGNKQGRLMITNGSPNPNPNPNPNLKMVSSGRSRVNSFSSSPLVLNNHLINNNALDHEEQYFDKNNNNKSHNHDDHLQQEDYVVEDIRWDSLFQDLKPT